LSACSAAARAARGPARSPSTAPPLGNAGGAGRGRASFSSVSRTWTSFSARFPYLGRGCGRGCGCARERGRFVCALV
jgi:hypothetical protein